MNTFVVSGLVKRRAQLAGDIEKAHEALRRMVLDLENLDATILQFEPNFRVETILPKAFRPPKDWSNRGEMTRICLSILRQAAEPLTTRDIALQLLTERALNREDVRLLRLMTKRVGVALGYSGTKELSNQIRARANVCSGRSKNNSTPPCAGDSSQVVRVWTGLPKGCIEISGQPPHMVI